MNGSEVGTGKHGRRRKLTVRLLARNVKLPVLNVSNLKSICNLLTWKVITGYR